MSGGSLTQEVPFWKSRADASLAEYGVVPSASFTSASPRSLPWDGMSQRRSSHPGPNSHADGPLHDRAMATSKQMATSSAAFASGSGRFRVRRATGDGGASAPFDCGAMVSTTSQVFHQPVGGWAGGRRSAAFASTTRRLPAHKTASPGPGVYTPATPYATATAGGLASGRCASVTATSTRRLPFESGGGRGSDVEAPPPTHYTPNPSADYRGRDSSDRWRAPKSGGSAMAFTSPRFAHGHYHSARAGTPGPGAYASAESDPRTIGSALGGAARHGVMSHTQERRLNFDLRRTPGAGKLDPRRTHLSPEPVPVPVPVPSHAPSPVPSRAPSPGRPPAPALRHVLAARGRRARNGRSRGRRSSACIGRVRVDVAPAELS